ncbi:hypothetical protein HOY34_01725 [Xinfangfangia sp. D13-10-4-6]|uniref:DUF6925 family protein n=1 Tax=Pseudogemmobacter hezensis TaxID=2737662 RepID=UPI001554F361|nr:hypothetical protein [Pseudogemmobacter hezensis]NPD13917.1 hypothetical protein [Pseudogemmobacter hezensis]
MTDPTPRASQYEAEALLARLFGASGHLWSVGTLQAFIGTELAAPSGGPISDVPRSAGDEVVIGDAMTQARTRARLRPGARLLAFETLSSDPRGWNHAIALCATDLPPRRKAQSAALALISGDADAILADHRDRAALDLGLGHPGLCALFRPDPFGVATSKALIGQCFLAAKPALMQIAGTWIVDTPFVRIEVTTAPGDPCPLHHIPDPRGRTHAATTPLPPGWLPLAHIFPPHPARLRPGVSQALDHEKHRAFQAILAQHGRADLWALKTALRAQLQSGSFQPPDTDRHGAAVIRVALRQWLAETGTAPPLPWLERFDRPLLAALRKEGG